MNILQAFDQLQAMLRDFSPVLYSYKRNLIKEGFTEEQAMELVVSFQEAFLHKQNEE